MARQRKKAGKALRAKVVGQPRRHEDGDAIDPDVARVMDWVGRNLAALRRARRWTQAEAADELGADVKAIRRAESGTANLTNRFGRGAREELRRRGCFLVREAEGLVTPKTWASQGVVCSPDDGRSLVSRGWAPGPTGSRRKSFGPRRRPSCRT